MTDVRIDRHGLSYSDLVRQEKRTCAVGVSGDARAVYVAAVASTDVADKQRPLAVVSEVVSVATAYLTSCLSGLDSYSTAVGKYFDGFDVCGMLLFEDAGGKRLGCVVVPHLDRLL